MGGGGPIGSSIYEYILWGAVIGFFSGYTLGCLVPLFIEPDYVCNDMLDQLGGQYFFEAVVTYYANPLLTVLGLEHLAPSNVWGSYVFTGPMPLEILLMKKQNIFMQHVNIICGQYSTNLYYSNTYFKTNFPTFYMDPATCMMIYSEYMEPLSLFIV